MTCCLLINQDCAGKTHEQRFRELLQGVEKSHHDVCSGKKWKQPLSVKMKEVASNLMTTLCHEVKHRKDPVNANGSCQKQWRWEGWSRYQDPAADQLSGEVGHAVKNSQKSRRLFPHNPCIGCFQYLDQCVNDIGYGQVSIFIKLYQMCSVCKFYLNLKSVYLIPLKQMSSLLCHEQLYSNYLFL